MSLKCSGCGDIAEGETQIRYCRKITNKNRDPCGSLLFPTEYEKPEPKKARKDGE
jgi:hypothetical protein